MWKRRNVINPGCEGKRRNCQKRMCVRVYVCIYMYILTYSAVGNNFVGTHMTHVKYEAAPIKLFAGAPVIPSCK